MIRWVQHSCRQPAADGACVVASTEDLRVLQHTMYMGSVDHASASCIPASRAFCQKLHPAHGILGLLHCFEVPSRLNRPHTLCTVPSPISAVHAGPLACQPCPLLMVAVVWLVNRRGLLLQVNWTVMKEWVAKRVTELLGIEEEVLISMIHNHLIDQVGLPLYVMC